VSGASAPVSISRGILMKLLFRLLAKGFGKGITSPILEPRVRLSGLQELTDLLIRFLLITALMILSLHLLFSLIVLTLYLIELVLSWDSISIILGRSLGM
jgi:hypothetical protein